LKSLELQLGRALGPAPNRVAGAASWFVDDGERRRYWDVYAARILARACALDAPLPWAATEYGIPFGAWDEAMRLAYG
jgi:hypothetical protein